MSRLSEYLDADPNSTHGSNCFARVLKLKVKPFHGTVWYGWLSSKEILYVVDCWKCVAVDPIHVERARVSHIGDSTPRHFYFIVDNPARLKLKA